MRVRSFHASSGRALATKAFLLFNLLQTKTDCLPWQSMHFLNIPVSRFCFSPGAPQQIPAALAKDSSLRLPSRRMFFLPQKLNHSSHNSSPVSSPSAHYGCWPAGESHPTSVSYAHSVIYSVLLYQSNTITLFS